MEEEEVEKEKGRGGGGADGPELIDSQTGEQGVVL